MLGVGWTEMLVIGVVALIVIGPKELPALMRRLGQVAGTVRRMGSDFQRELNKSTGLDEVRNLRTAITQPLKHTTDAIRKEFNTMGPSGVTVPSGALKPADPNAESVVDEIKAAAGLPFTKAAADSMREAVTKGSAAKAAAAAAAAEAAAPAAAAPVKAKRVRKATPAPTAAVTSSDLDAAPPPPARPAATKAPAKARPVASPAPAEALPPAAKPKAAAKPKPAAKPKAAAKPAATPEAAAKPAASRGPRRPASKKSS